MAITQNAVGNFAVTMRTTWHTAAHFGYDWVNAKTSGNITERLIPTIKHLPYKFQLKRVTLGYTLRTGFANPPFRMFITGVEQNDAPDGFSTGSFVKNVSGTDYLVFDYRLWANEPARRIHLQWTLDQEMLLDDFMVAEAYSMNTTDINNFALSPVDPLLSGWYGPQELSITWYGERLEYA
jgi:hypothetical protein